MKKTDYTFLARIGFADPDRQSVLHDGACLYLSQDKKVSKFRELLGLSDQRSGEEFYDDRPIHHDVFADAWTAGKRQDFFGDSGPYPRERIVRRARLIEKRWELRRNTLSFPLSTYDRWNNPSVIGFYDLFLAWQWVEEWEWEFELRVADRVFPVEAVAVDGFLPECCRLWEEKSFMIQTQRLDGLRWNVHLEKPENVSASIEVKAGRMHVTNIIQQMQTYKTYDPDSVQFVATCYPVSALERKTLESHGIRVLYVNPGDVRDYIDPM